MTIFKNYFSQQFAFSYKNFRLFISGQTLSLIGSWTQRMAMVWLAYSLTKSPFLLGLVGFCEQIPLFIIAPFAGVYADRWNKKKALLIIEFLAMLQALFLAYLTFTNQIQIIHILILSLFLGVINAFEIPIRQSYVIDMVNKDVHAIPNAIAINSTMFNLSRLIGPIFAGILINATNEAWCFVANGVSYAMVIITLFIMNTKSIKIIRNETVSVWNNLKEGFVYIKQQKYMSNLLLLLAIVSFSNAAFKTLAPIFSINIFHGNSKTLGYLMTATGIGAIIGALILTRKKDQKYFQKILNYTGILLGISIFLFGSSKWFLVSLVLISVAGFSQIMHTASTNTLLQLNVSDNKRGRIMSFYTVCLQGTMPIGSLVTGIIANYFTAPIAMMSMGVFCIIGSLYYAAKLRKTIHSNFSTEI